MILGFNANSGASSIPLNYGLSQDPLNGNTQNIDYPQFEQFIRKCNLFEYYLRRFLSIACLPLFLTKTLHYLFIAGLFN
jgi:hypothetical protein